MSAYGIPETLVFNSPLWTEITWLLWAYPFNPGAPDSGFFSMTFQVGESVKVAEPGALGLVAVGVLGIAISRRRRHRLRQNALGACSVGRVFSSADEQAACVAGPRQPARYPLKRQRMCRSRAVRKPLRGGGNTVSQDLTTC